MRVLVVEDEQDVGDVFLDYLLELGHQPLLVRTAEAALGKLVTERPDAMIVDINLPGMSGLEFLQLRPIRESGVPIVAVSGVATEGQARECLRLGAVDFMGKPLPFDRLQEVLTYLEPHALDRKLNDKDPAKPDRRRHPRAPLTIPVQVMEYGGASWQGTSVDVSVGGIRLSARSTARAGIAVRLTFTLPDGGPTMTVMGLLVRVDAGGYAFQFVNLTSGEAGRLRDLVARFV
jgi:DNA-binding response OmpR family regulator